MKNIFIVDFISFKDSVPKILSEAKLEDKIRRQKKIILKPNLTTNLPPPCTTPVELVEETIKFCQKYSQAEILIAEGSGGCNTLKAFADLGYQKLAEMLKVKLVDLNREERILKENTEARVIKKVKIPKILFSDCFLINLPVLKQHDEGILTCAAKNLFGIYLNENFGSRLLPHWWNKSELHFKYGVQESIWDLNLYAPVDFVLVDASIGQKGNEIHGTPCNPPIKKLIAGFNNFEVDRYCAPLLDLDPQGIPYLNF